MTSCACWSAPRSPACGCSTCTACPGQSGPTSWPLHGAPPGYAPPAADASCTTRRRRKASLEALVQACATAGEPFDEEMQIVTLKGRRAWVRSVGTGGARRGRRIVAGGGRRAGDRAARPRARHAAAPHRQHGRRDGQRRGIRHRRPRRAVHLRQRAGRAAAGHAGARTAGPADLELVPEDRARARWRSSSAQRSRAASARGRGARRAPVAAG